MTKLKLRQAAPCEYPFVACMAMSDGTGDDHHERVRKPTYSMLEQAGANHFIETRIFLPTDRRFIIRVDGYKKP